MENKHDKRRPGRPATGHTPKRYFRIDDDAWFEIVSAAERAGLSTSEWIRDRLAKAAKREAR